MRRGPRVNDGKPRCPQCNSGSLAYREASASCRVCGAVSDLDKLTGCVPARMLARTESGSGVIAGPSNHRICNVPVMGWGRPKRV